MSGDVPLFVLYAFMMSTAISFYMLRLQINFRHGMYAPP